MSRPISCEARQDGEDWLACVPKHGVYGRGRTLKALQDDLTQGLALIGVTAKVTLTPVSPELQRLRAAKASYESALGRAIVALAAGQATVADTARATGVTLVRVNAILAKRQTTKTSPSQKRNDQGAR